MLPSFHHRDDPKSVDCLVVSNCANVDCEFRIEGNNLFSAVRYVITVVLMSICTTLKPHSLWAHNMQTWGC